MNDNINDGGPAFPLQHTVADANNPLFKRGQPGMSLRDLFAAMASDADISDVIQRNAALSNPDTQNQIGGIFRHPTRQEARFIHADYMLTAREKKP